MKKIFTVANAKNESDIIESFCRYNLTYCDGMIIYERASTDNTNEIIRSLIAEGLPIHLYDDPNIVMDPYKEGSAKDAMAHRAIDEYGADLVVPLDADEFLYHIDGISPRDTLESLSEDVEYTALWRSYVYEQEPDIGLGFVPNNFMRYRNPEAEPFAKVIASKKLIKEKHARIALGAHHLNFSQEIRPLVSVEQLPKLVFSHFPIRSGTQHIAKIILKWIYDWRKPFPGKSNYGGHYEPILNDIKAAGKVSHELLVKHSLLYSIQHVFQLTKSLLDLEERATIEGQMDVSFCFDRLNLRYTDYQELKKSFYRDMLSEIKISFEALPRREWLTLQMLEKARSENHVLVEQRDALTDLNKSLVDNSTELVNQKQLLISQHYDIVTQRTVLFSRHNDLVSQHNDLSNQIDSIYESDTWKSENKFSEIFNAVCGLQGFRV